MPSIQAEGGGAALLHQGAIALVIIAFLWLAWATARAWRLSAPSAKTGGGEAAEADRTGAVAGTPTAGSAVRGWRAG